MSLKRETGRGQPRPFFFWGRRHPNQSSRFALWFAKPTKMTSLGKSRLVVDFLSATICLVFPKKKNWVWVFWVTDFATILPYLASLSSKVFQMWREWGKPVL